MTQISEIFLWFMLYSIIGWAYETVICSLIKYHRVINRGFYIGPYCPIYGIGAVICFLLLDDIRYQIPGIGGVLVIFILSGFIACTIEYFISWLMEKLFHARWWDYIDRPFNLNGRICLGGFLVFGAGVTLVLYFVQPLLMKLTGMLSPFWTNLIAGILAVIYAADAVVSLCSCFGFSKTMRRVHDELERRIDVHMDALTEKAAAHENSAFAKAGRSVLVKYHDFSMSLKNREIRFLKAFPGLKVPSLRESGFVEKLREYMKKDSHDKTEK